MSTTATHVFGVVVPCDAALFPKTNAAKHPDRERGTERAGIEVGAGAAGFVPEDEREDRERQRCRREHRRECGEGELGVDHPGKLDRVVARRRGTRWVHLGVV